MPMVNAGRDLMLDLLIGAGGNAYNASNTRIGVGDSSTAHATSQTDLQAATNKLRKLVDSAPSRTTNVLTFIATFTGSEANFAWQEIGIFNASSAGTMLSRLVQSMGTKASPAVWVVTYTLTVTV